MRRPTTYVRYKLYQVPLFLSWLLALTHCAGNMEGAADVNQAFSSTNTAALASNGAYQVVNAKSQLALDLQRGGNGNTPVVTNQPSNATSQQWQLRAESNGSYALINAQTQQALDVYNALSTPGTPVQTSTDTQAANEQWKLAAQGNNLYQVINSASGACLDLTSGATSPGTLAQQWTCASQSAEMLWELIPVAGTGTTVAGNGNTEPSVNANVPNPAAQPNTVVSPNTSNGGSGSYTTTQLAADMNNVLQLRTPVYSNRNLGNPSNIAMWTPDKIQSLMNGIITAHDVFYKNISLVDLAHLIVAEGAQESTGNYNLPGWSEGFIQSTPSTVGVDYTNHGQAVAGSVGTLLSPGTAVNYDDPGQNVATWAWYTYNVVAAGESMNEVADGNPEGQVTRDFGNAEFDWLAGPHNDRHNPAQAAAYQDYHDRIKDYFVQSNFGTADQFENLLNTPIGSTMIDEH